MEVVVDADLTRSNRRGATLTVEGDGIGSLTEAVSAQDTALLLPADRALEKFVRNLASGGVATARAHAFFDKLMAGDDGVSMKQLWAML